MTVRGLRPLSILSIVLIAIGFGLVFFYAPLDTDQGFRQKIFYLHVPLGIIGLIGFVIGGWHGLRYLRTGDGSHDLKSYVYIHQSQIIAVIVLITGGIWGAHRVGRVVAVGRAVPRVVPLPLPDLLHLPGAAVLDR